MAFTTVLVANRGEIACRVMRTAARQGYRTVAVYSAADADALHVRSAHAAVAIGGAAPADSYLNIDNILQAARASGADAIHPGYGFLSENAGFAAACTEAGITFIGPSARAIDLMGNKSQARQLMHKAGVPCVPGYDGADQSDETLQREAGRIGYPVMVKAASGGGGRGMRLVHAATELSEALASARAEALKAFGSDQLLLEKAILNPRHVEFQVFADSHGNVIHLGERDCSAQRRHQKVIEEAPCPVMTPELRARMGKAATDAARTVDYVGAGTVEFLLDASGGFYFLEMNTRLQVEHPVTELITGQDLVAWQLAVAAGEKLPLMQDEIRLHGHAIEVRLYAEDRHFLPQTGTLLRWQPADDAVRIDSGVGTGSRITPYYDPMLAKVIAWGEDRDAARRKLVSALRDSRVLGVATNKAFLAELCEHPVFAAGETTTAFIGDHFSTLAGVEPSATEWALAALALLLAGNPQPQAYPAGWRNGGDIPALLKLVCGSVQARASASRIDATNYRFTIRTGDSDASICELTFAEQDADGMTVLLDGVRRHVACALDGDTLWLDANLPGSARETLCIRNLTQQPAASGARHGSGVLLSPMDGVIARVLVAAGDAVTAGQLLMTVEAMKMEHRITADVDGIVEQITDSVGTTVRNRQKLVAIRAATPLTPTPLPEGERGQDNPEPIRHRS